MFNDYIDVRVYQASPGDGRSKQLATELLDMWTQYDGFRTPGPNSVIRRNWDTLTEFGHPM